MLDHLKSCIFGLAVYVEFLSEQKRLQYFQLRQLPPPSRPVLLCGAERSKPPLKRSATPSVREEDVVTAYLAWQHVSRTTKKQEGALAADTPTNQLIVHN